MAIGSATLQGAAKTARRRRIARLTVAGFSLKEIAEQLGYASASAITRDYQAAETQEEVVRLLSVTEDLILEDLFAAERKAIRVLDALLDDPDPKIRLGAAVQALDRAGKRGKPVEKVEQSTLTLTGDAAKVAVANALRDPGVRKLLDERPQLRAQLLLEASDATDDNGPKVPGPV